MPLATFKSIEPCGSPLSNKHKAENIEQHNLKRKIPLWICAEEDWKCHKWYLSNKSFQHRFQASFFRLVFCTTLTKPCNNNFRFSTEQSFVILGLSKGALTIIYHKSILAHMSGVKGGQPSQMQGPTRPLSATQGGRQVVKKARHTTVLSSWAGKSLSTYLWSKRRTTFTAAGGEKTSCRHSGGRQVVKKVFLLS